MAKIVYIGIFLGVDVKQRIRQMIGVETFHSKEYLDHITLAFSPNEQQIKDAEPYLGKMVPFTLGSMYWNLKGQAVTVNLPSLPTGLIPESAHITVSCAEGVPPKYSNDLIKETLNSDRASVLTLPRGILWGRLDYFPGK